MDAGAFSSREVVEAGEGILFLLVDCSNRTADTDRIAKKYGVRGFPTVLLCSPEGKKVAHIGRDRSAATVARQFKSLKASPQQELTWTYSFSEGMAAAIRSKKPLILWVHGKDPAETKAMQDTFYKRVAFDVLVRAVLVKVPFDPDDRTLKRCGVTRGPTLMVLDPLASNPNRPILKIHTWNGSADLSQKVSQALQKMGR